MTKREAREVLRRADPEEPTGAPSPGEVEMADEVVG